MISGNLPSARLENDDSKRKRPRPLGSSLTALGSAKEKSSKKRRNAGCSITKKSQQMPPSTSLARISEILRKRTPRPLKKLTGFQKGVTSPSSKRQGASSSGKSNVTCTPSKTHGKESMRKEEKKKKKILMVKETESTENLKVHVVSSRGKKSAVSARAYMACFIEQRKRINLASLEELICPWEQPDSIQKIQNSREFLSKAVDDEKDTRSSKDSNHDRQASGSGDVDGTADLLKLVEPVLSNEKPVDADLTCTSEQEEEISEIRDGTYGNPNSDSREHFEGNSFDQAGEKILWTASGELKTVAWTKHGEGNNNGKGLESGDNDRVVGREKLLHCSGCNISRRQSSLSPSSTDTATRVLHCPACVRQEEKFSRFVEYWVPAQISNVQLEQYCEMLLSNAVLLCSSSRLGPVAALRDILINAHKCCNHPYIADPNLPSLLSRHVQATEYLDVGIKASGKLVLLDKLLHSLKKQKMRVLILFQSIGGCKNRTGDILDDYVGQRFGADSYERVDGGIVSSRILAALNKFNQMDQGRFVFLLENRACHHRIVLTSVDVVIIFDSDWNPINDLRNLQKISLKSELEQVRVFRLYTSFTVEEKVLVCAKHGTAWDNKLLSVNSSTSQMLLMWGASYLMKKLEEFHNSSNMYISESDQRLTENVAQEFLTLLHLGKEKSVKSSCLITKAHVGLAGYGTDSLLCGELTLQFEPKELPHIFWSRLLDGKAPCWKYVCVSSQRSRKRGGQLNDQFKDDSGNAQKKQCRMLSTKKPGPMEERAANNEVPRNDCTASPETGIVQQDERRMFIDAQRSLHVKIKQEILRLSEVLELSGDIRVVIEIFLDYVINNHQLPREPPPTTLQAFQLSMCWTSASLLNEKMDHKESVELSKKHLGYSCTKEEADYAHTWLRDLKKLFLATLESSQLIDSCKAPELLTKVLEVNHPSAKPLRPASRAACTRSKVLTSPKARDENRLNSFSDQPDESVNLEPPLEAKGNGISQDYEALKESLEKAYQMEVAIVRLHHIGSKQTDKLEIMKGEHAKKLKELELAHLTAKNRIPHGTKSFSVKGDRNSFEGIAHLKEMTDEIDYAPCKSTDPDARINVHDVENGDSEGTSNTTKAPGSKSSSKEASLQPEADNETADSISTSSIAEFAQAELLCQTGSMRNHQGDVCYGNTCPGEVAFDKEMIGGAEKETLPGSAIPLFSMQNAESIPPDDLPTSQTSIDGGGWNQEQQDNLLESEVQAPNPCNSTSSDMEERNGLPPVPQNTMEQRELEERDSRNGKLSDHTIAWMEPVVQPQVSGDVSPPTASLECAVENQPLGDSVTSQQMLTGMQATGGSLMPPMQTRSLPLAHPASGALGSSGDPLSSVLGPRSLPSQPFVQGSPGMCFPWKSNPLEMELEKIRKEKEHAERTYDNLTLRLKYEREREIQEAVAQIHMKFDCKFKEAEADYSLKKNGLDLNMYGVYMNKMLAQDFRRTWVDFKSSGLQGGQTGWSPDLAPQRAISFLARGFQRQSVPGVHGLPPNSSRVHAATLSCSQSIPPVPLNSHNLFQATLPINSVLLQSSSVAPRSLMDPASLPSNSMAPNLTTPILVAHPTVKQAHALAPAPAPHLQRFRPPPVGPISPELLPNLASNISSFRTLHISNQVLPSAAVTAWVRNRFPGSSR